MRPGVAWFAGWLLFAPAAAWAEAAAGAPALGEELNRLREELRAVRQELQEIKTLLQQGHRAVLPPSSQDVVLRLDPGRVKGRPGARVVLVEFSDFECPFCARFALDVLPQLEREYVATGKIRYFFRHYPLTVLHRNAFRAAEAAACAQEQGRFWEMHARLFQNQTALEEEALTAYAGTIGLDADRFRACLAAGAQTQTVRADLAEALQARVRGTPTFFLGLADAGATEMRPVDVIMGAQPYLAFKMAIERLLDGAP